MCVCWRGWGIDPDQPGGEQVVPEESGDTTDAPPALVGRERELGIIGSLVESVADGQGAFLALPGEVGTGKTALLAHLRAGAMRHGLGVFLGTARREEQQEPFALLRRCIGSGSQVVARQPHGVGQELHRLVMAEALADLVEKLCADGPVVLLVDDMQWADDDTALVLHRVASTVSHLPLLIAVAYSPSWDAATYRPAARNAVTVPVRPLTDDAAHRLVEQLLDAVPGPELRHAVADAQGNPFIIRELVTAYRSQGHVRVTGRAASLAEGSPDLPRTVAETVLDRLMAVPRDARAMLRSAAVLGATIDISLLAMVGGTRFSTVKRVVENAIGVGLLVSDRERTRFRHDLVRRALVAEVPPADRARLHALAAGALLRVGADVERVAEHLIEAPALEPDAVDWLVRSLDALLAQAPAAMVTLLPRVLATLDGATDVCAQLRAALAHAYLNADQPAEAEATARAALASIEEPAARGQLHQVIAEVSFRRGDFAAVLRDVAGAFKEPDLPRDRRAGLTVLAAQSHYYRGDIESATERVREPAARGGHLHQVGLLNVLSGIDLMQRGPGQALTLSRRAVSCLGASATTRHRVASSVYLTQGMNLLESDRLAEAEHAFSIGIRSDPATGGAFTPALHLGQALVSWWDGRWDRAIEELDAAADVDDRLGLAQGVHGLAALIAIHRGGGVGTLVLQLSQAPAETIGGRFFGMLRGWAAGLAAEAAGDVGRASELLLETWRTTPSRCPVRYYLAPDLARIAARTGDMRAATLVAAELGEYVAERPNSALRAIAQLCRGIARRDPAALGAAAGALADAGRPLLSGYAHESVGAILAQTGGGAEAAHEFAAAERVYRELGARQDLARVGSSVEGQAVAGAGRSAGADAVELPEILTRGEQRVALLVARGMSNREIGMELSVSPRTVQAHVSSILRKLSLRSRVELARVLRKRS